MIPDKCVNSGLLNDDILIKYVNVGVLNDDTLIKTNVSMVVYWMMIFWLKQSDTWKLKQSDTVSMVVYWMMIFWLKQSDTWKLKQSDTWQMCQ